MFNYLLKKNSFVFILLFSLGFLTYSNSIKNEFVYDDLHVIVRNPLIKQIKYWPRIFKTDVFPELSNNIRYYRPLPVLTHALEYKIWKLNPRPYHINNIILHCLNGCIVFYLIRMLFNDSKLGLLTSVIFIIHPIQTACVNWIVCRDTLLLSFFGLLSLMTYVLFLKSGNKIQYAFSLALFILSMLCKDIAFLFIPLLGLCAIKYKQRILVVLKQLLPFIFVFAVYMLFRVFVLKASFLMNKYNFEFSLPITFLNFFNIIFGYLRLLIAPIGLHVSRLTSFLVSFSDWRAISVLCGALGSGVLFFWSIKKKKDYFWFGLAWFIIFTSFVVKGMYLKISYGALMSELWLYLPSVGVFLIFSHLFLKLLRNYKLLFICLLGVLSFFWITLSIYYNRLWNNDIILFNNALRFSEQANDIRLNLMLSYLNTKEYDLARREFLKAQHFDPRIKSRGVVFEDILYSKQYFNQLFPKISQYSYVNSSVLNSLGFINAYRGKDNIAFLYFIADTQLDINPSIINTSLDRYYFDFSDYSELLSDLPKPVKLNLSKDSNSINLGNIYAAYGFSRKNTDFLADSIYIKPSLAQVLISLGKLYQAKGKFNLAYDYWQKAYILDPDNLMLKDDLQRVQRLIEK